MNKTGQLTLYVDCAGARYNEEGNLCNFPEEKARTLAEFRRLRTMYAKKHTPSCFLGMVAMVVVTWIKKYGNNSVT